MTVALCGFMGCGKSSIGRLAGRLAGLSFSDLDDRIEKEIGKSIPEIFASAGEKGFREIEFHTLTKMIERDSQLSILALGGGTLTDSRSAAIIKEKTKCIYLRASIDTLVSNIEMYPSPRPKLGELHSHDELVDRVSELMSERKSLYEDAADITIDTDSMDYAKIASEIAQIAIRLSPHAPLYP